MIAVVIYFSGVGFNVRFIHLYRGPVRAKLISKGCSKSKRKANQATESCWLYNFFRFSHKDIHVLFPVKT